MKTIEALNYKNNEEDVNDNNRICGLCKLVFGKG